MLRMNAPATQPCQGLLIASMMAVAALSFASFAQPALAQDVETFDPDEAFEQSAPTPTPVPVPTATPIPSQIPEGIPDTAQPREWDPAVPVGSAQDDGAIDGDLWQGDNAPGQSAHGTAEGFRQAPMLDPATGNAVGEGGANVAQSNDPLPQWGDPAQSPNGANAASEPDTYGEDDLIGAAEGVFGKGARGLAKMIENLLAKQGRPNGYIVGREAGGAFVFGARYGSGTLHHKIEGERKVYWTGPSLGLDAGANAGNTFVLVYNLFDTEDIFKRYPSGEGQAYLLGGLHASYMRRGDVVLIPIRMGAGLRLGVNAGYMRFSKKQRWLPF